MVLRLSGWMVARLSFFFRYAAPRARSATHERSENKAGGIEASFIKEGIRWINALTPLCINPLMSCNSCIPNYRANAQVLRIPCVKHSAIPFLKGLSARHRLQFHCLPSGGWEL